MLAESKLYHIDRQYNVFNRSVTRVVDLGFVPGNWLTFTRNRLCEIHGLEHETLHRKCKVLGVDLLFAAPPIGTSSIQGNIFLQLTHDSIRQHFVAPTKVEHEPTSYFSKENELADQLASMSLDSQPEHRQVDVILSDILKPFMQESGFFNNTQTRPYIRLGTNQLLKKVITEPVKTAIDHADAALLLACTLLKKNGTLVLRLAVADPDNHETDLLRARLDRVFHRVEQWHHHDASATSELVLVCQKKRELVADKRAVFAPRDRR